MTTEQVLQIVRDRGLRIELKDGRPVLVGAAHNPEVTDRLLAVLKIHREWIIEKLRRGSNGAR